MKHPTTRRTVLQAVSTLTAAAALGGLSRAAAAADSGTRAARPLRLLILGGTRFIGLHMAELALARGHTLTFFNRGRTNTGRFAEVERLLGDRNNDIQSLANREWDAVIDNSGYTPRQVRTAAALLEPKVRHYVFISSVSVYASFAAANDETSAVGKLPDETVEKVDGLTYGPLKALSEAAARSVFGDSRTTLIRPGLIVGPDDNTDRFTYWPARAARGGRFIAPGSPRDPIQIIDVRDLAAFTLRCIEAQVSGTFNALSPPDTFTMGQLVDAAVGAARELAQPAAPPQPVWLDAAALEARKIAPWSDMPAWAPSMGDNAGFAATSALRALRAGLVVRPMQETARDTLRWHLARPEAERGALKAGLAAAREAELLAALSAAGNPR